MFGIVSETGGSHRRSFIGLGPSLYLTRCVTAVTLLCQTVKSGFILQKVALM